MSLSRAQYDEIMRAFEERRIANHHIFMEHREEVYDLIPEYKELDTSIAELSVEQGKKLIQGDDDALEVMRDKIAKIKARKKELLNEYAFPENYLEPIYTCGICKDTGYVDGEKCSCLNRAIIRLLYAQSNIEAVLNEENFDNLSYEYYNDSDVEMMRRIVQECREFAQSFDDHYQNLLLFGEVGVGKTYLTNCIAGELLGSGHSVIYFTSFQLFDTLAKYAFRLSDVKEDISAIHEDVFSCDLLIIDDLGTEMTNSFVSSQLFVILNERNLRKKSTIISTNLTLQALNERYSERNFSRIFGYYKMLKIDIEDIRMKIRRLKHTN